MDAALSNLSNIPMVGRFGRFQTRLFLLVLLLVVPAFGLVLYGNLEQRRVETARVRDGAAAISQLVAANQENFIKSSAQLLATLADIPFLVRATNRAACEIHFVNLRKLLPDYVNFGLIETNGLVFCSAVPTNGPVYLGDRSYFQRVVQTRKFSIGDFQVGRLTSQPALNFAYPVLDEQGHLLRVLYASLKLSLLSAAAAKVRLPSGGTVMVIDRNGNVLARVPEPERWVGQALAKSPVVQRIMAQPPGVFEMPGLDGIPRLHAVTTVAEGAGMFVSVGIPVSVSFAHANEMLLRNFVILGIVAAVVFAAAWFYARQFFLRPVHALVRMARQLADGNPVARTGTIRGTAELLQLGYAFDDMAERLEKRQSEVELAHRQISTLNRELEQRVQERTAQLEATNKELAHERHLLRMLMDNVPSDIYFKDIESRFLRNNRAHAQRFGLDEPAQAIGKTDFDFFSAEHAQQARADELQVIRSGQPIHKEEMETWPDGQVTWALTVKLPLRDENGLIIGTFGISHDITARKQAEEALRGSEARYHTLFDSIDEGFCVIEMICDEQESPVDYRFLEVNPSFEKQTGLADVVGKRMRELAPQHEAHWFEVYGRIAASGEAARFQNYAAQLARWYDVYAFRFGDPKHRQVAVLFSDISARKASEAKIAQLNTELQQQAAELAEANKELASFSYSVSHDLRSPLRGIDGFCQALAEDYGDKLDETAKDHLARVRAAARRMGELIDDLLKLARITRAEMCRQPVDLSSLANTIATELQHREPHRQVQWVIAEELSVEGDPQLLRVALENLLGNAWKFTGRQADARIELGELQCDGHRVLFIRDNGAGFDMAFAAKLFGAFQRLHTLAEFEGTGIGLATVQRILHRHGGRVWAEAEVEKGATFYFAFDHERRTL